jgi:hypothetical protein
MRLRLVFFAPLAAIAIPFFGACSNEGEGQPCDGNAGGTPAGTNDCSSPLQCVPSPNPAITGRRCCPVDPSQATTIECSAVTTALDASPAPSDASTATEAASEAGADGPVAEGSAETGPASDASDAAVPRDASEGGAAADATDAPAE